jgi:hypothetical protein
MEFLDWVGMGRFNLGWGDSGNVSCLCMWIVFST